MCTKLHQNGKAKIISFLYFSKAEWYDDKTDKSPIASH